jgi:hypothetical protein
VTTHSSAAGHLQIRDAAGHVVRSLGVAFEARWSPDGMHLAWVDAAGVHVSGIDGSGARRLVPSPRFPAGGCDYACLGRPNVAWSPDSRFLAVGGAGDRTQHLLVVPVDGGPAVDVASPGSLEIADGWTRDGRVIYVATTGCCRRELRDGAANGAGTRLLYRYPSRSFALPSVAPDGHAVGLVAPVGRSKALRVVDLQTGGRRDVALPGALLAAAPAWAPDARRVALARPHADALLVDTRTGQVSTLPGRAEALSFTRSGELLWLRGSEVWISRGTGRPHLLFRLHPGQSVVSLDAR